MFPVFNICIKRCAGETTILAKRVPMLNHR